TRQAFVTVWAHVGIAALTDAGFASSARVHAARDDALGTGGVVIHAAQVTVAGAVLIIASRRLDARLVLVTPRPAATVRPAAVGVEPAQPCVARSVGVAGLTLPARGDTAQRREVAATAIVVGHTGRA